MASNQAKIIISAEDDTRRAWDSAMANASRYSREMSSVAASLGGAWGKLGSLAGVAFAGFTLAGVTAEIIESAEQLGNLADRTGLAVQTLGELKYAAQQSDTDLGQLAQGMKKLRIAQFEAASGNKELGTLFRALNIDVRDVSGNLRNSESVFYDVADRVAALGDEQSRTAVMTKLMGKSADELLPLMIQGSQAIRDMRQEARDLGVVMDEQTVASIKAMNDNLDALKSSVTAAAANMTRDLWPALTDITEAMKEASKQGGILDGVLGGLGEVKRKVYFQNLPDEFAHEEADRLRQSLKNVRQERWADSPYNRQLAESLEGDIAYLEKVYARYQSKQAEILAAPYVGQSLDARDGLAYRNQAVLDRQLRRALEDAAVPKEHPRTGSAADPFDELRRSLTMRLADQRELSELEKLDLTLQDKKYAKLLPAQREELKGLTGLIDLSRDAKLQAAERAKLQQINEEAADRNREATESYVQSLRDQGDEQAFQLSLLGKSRAETERLTALHQLDVQLATARDALDANDPERIAKEWELAEATEAAKDATLRYLDTQQALSEDWRTGAVRALDGYLEHVRDVAGATEDLMTNAFQGMEDALVEFATTGRLSFDDLARSIIADLVRIQIRQNITGPLAEWMKGGSSGGGLLDGLMELFDIGPGVIGAGLAVGGPALPGSLHPVNEQGPELLTVGGRDYLMMGAQPGYVTPNNRVQFAGGPQVTNHINVQVSVPASTDRRSAEQLAAVVADRIGRAQARYR